MRTDLTANFTTELSTRGRVPIQLAVFKFADGDVCVSDRDITVGGVAYSGLVEDWGELADSSLDMRSNVNGLVREVSVTLWNGGTTPFYDHFSTEDPENVQVYLYQWFAGLSVADLLLIDIFTVQDPIEASQASQLLTLDLVSITANLSSVIGTAITKAAYPYCADEDVGKYLPIAYGTAGKLPTIKAIYPLSVTLDSEHLPTDTTITVNEDLADFPTTGTIKIGVETITYTGKTTGVGTSSFTGCTRGSGAVYTSGEILTQVITNQTHFLCEGAVASISNILVDGSPVAGGIATTYTTNPARVVFSERPYHQTFSPTTASFSFYFDTVTGGDPSWAYGQGSFYLDAYYPTVIFTEDGTETDLGTIRSVKLEAKYGCALDNGATVTLKLGTTLLYTFTESDNEDYGASMYFDITSTVAGSWSWFTGRSITYELIGTPTNTYNPFIVSGRYQRFEVVYGSGAEREVFYSDEITAEVVGLEDDPSEAIDDMLTTRAGLASSFIDATSFAAALTSYATAGYTLDGILPGHLTAREAIDKILFQTHSRLFCNAGKIKLKHISGSPTTQASVVAWSSAYLAEKSITALRQSVREIINKIEFLYDRDNTLEPGIESFKESVQKANADSQTAFGVLEVVDKWQCDLISDSTMAAAVAAFYISYYSWPSTFFTFSTYLSAFKYEQGDIIQLTSDFLGINAAQMEIKGITRVFGSAKKSQINKINITAECWRFVGLPNTGFSSGGFGSNAFGS